MYTHFLPGEVIWKSPSNIAFIKYWGKKNKQIPLNPSLSLTLSQSCTQMHVQFSPREKKDSILKGFFFANQKHFFFEKKIIQFLQNIYDQLSYLQTVTLRISSTNNFPHSAGIASSAASMSALALCLCTIEKKINPSRYIDNVSFFRHASSIARLGSGSACRSVFGGITLWGNTSLYANSSDHYAIPLENIHPIFQNLCDTILIVDANKKKISSTKGHLLMHDHPFKQQKISLSNDHMAKMKSILSTGDVESFIAIVEKEALLLHAMMLTSQPYYMLLHPNSLAIIQRVIAWRKYKQYFVCFTIDAGPNIHLIYPPTIALQVKKFVEESLLSFCDHQKMIHDTQGNGPTQLL